MQATGKEYMSVKFEAGRTKKNIYLLGSDCVRGRGSKGEGNQ
jgi:hypothetical protein